MDKKKYMVDFRQKQLKSKIKAQFNTDLYYEEKKEIDDFLKSRNMTKREFLLKAKKILEESEK